ncbi:hypothetical protein MMC25_006642 [Agyrium rufum]|nr:hypothetical protein [Agyrium rufum]
MTSIDATKIPKSYATCSLGNGQDFPLPTKLEAISSAGFTGIELAFPDLQAFASQHLGKDVGLKAWDDLCEAGKEVKRLCEKNNLKVLMLQPFSNFEGWSKGSKEREDAFERARGWIEIMGAVGTDMLQVIVLHMFLPAILRAYEMSQIGSSDSPSMSTDLDVLASDLAELADIMAPKGYRITYENWCWATCAPTWETVWEIAKRADRDNIGLCLDTFQTAGGEWGDPTTKSGRIESSDETALNKTYQESLRKLSQTIPKDKIYLLQISDAYKPTEAISTALGEDGLRPRGRWSHDFRPMPFDGGYLPIVEMTKAVLDTGFRGWFSMEIFDGGASGKGKKIEPVEYARKAAASIEQLIQATTRM